MYWRKCAVVRSNLDAKRQMSMAITNASQSNLFGERCDRHGASGWSAAVLLVAVLCAAGVSAQTPADGAGDSGLLFWAVNEGGARIYKPTVGACALVRGLSAQYAEGISSRYQVPAYALRVLEVRPSAGSPECLLLVDTPVGTKECQLGSVIRTFGGSFLAHTYAQQDDGSVRYVSGVCR